MDTISEIKKLKELLDEGIITEEDFDKQKKKLLAMDNIADNVRVEKDVKTEKVESNSLDNYEKELMQEMEAENKDKTSEEAKNKENMDLYEKERLKEKARLDAITQSKKEKSEEIKQGVKQGINKGMSTGGKIFKWILAVFCWLATVGCVSALPTDVGFNISSAIIFALLGALACPQITKYTKKFEKYTKMKKWIVIAIIVLYLVLTSIYPPTPVQ